jgi:hypothetical protein
MAQQHKLLIDDAKKEIKRTVLEEIKYFYQQQAGSFTYKMYTILRIMLCHKYNKYGIDGKNIFTVFSIKRDIQYGCPYKRKLKCQL